jgi:pimeloyl-ACP methyl ester carboxylesterase
MRNTRRVIPILLLALAGLSMAADTKRTSVEEYVCGTEGIAIKLAKGQIQAPHAVVNWQTYGTEKLRRDQFTTADGRTINGLVWKATNPRGYLLIAQGSSMLAAEIYDDFSEFANLGLDVYLYDYRGYGMSNGGNTSLEAVIADSAQRIMELNRVAAYRYKFLYGISLGGVVFARAVNSRGLFYTAMVLDSVPHTLPFVLFCPSRFDPVANLPSDCRNWYVIAGGDDHVIGTRGMRLANAAVKKCHATDATNKSFGHIFMDGLDSQHLHLALDYFRKMMPVLKKEVGR